MAPSPPAASRRHFAACVLAQAAAELRMRRRSHSTLIAIVFLLLTVSFWIPDPSEDATSMSWLRSTDGVRVSGIYNLGYLSTVSGMLWGSLITLVGFYLVTGAVRRDERTGVGVLIAASPISRGAYVCGLFLAHVVFLLGLTAIALAVSILVFVRYGTEPFSFWPFALRMVLLAGPAVIFTAAVAVLFDIVARSARVGHILYFFVWGFLIGIIPAVLHQGFGPAARRPATDFTLFDPAGTATLSGAVYRTVPDSQPGTMAMGRQDRVRVERVDWPGLPVSTALVAGRIVSVLWAVPLLVLAARRFHRFDPAARRDVTRQQRVSIRAAFRAALQSLGQSLVNRVRALVPERYRELLNAVAIAPAGVAAALEAEARLIWQLAPWIKWPLLASSFAAVVDPGMGAVKALLILVAPVVAEAAAVEHLHGTASFIWCQPAIVGRRVLWKLAAVTSFVLLISLPAIAGTVLHAPAVAFPLVTALLFVVALSVSTGFITGGGKLFLAVYTLVWYASLSAPAPLDFFGTQRTATTWPAPAVHMVLSAVLVAIALLVDLGRRR